MSIILAEEARRHRGESVLVVIDQAGGHVAGDLVVPDNMRFLYLPHGSQELNPAEHVWEPLREKARQKMASRDLGFRDALHKNLEEYIGAVSTEDFTRFLGECHHN